MRFSEEMPDNSLPFCSCSAQIECNHEIRESIKSDIDLFLENGGQIKILKPGESAEFNGDKAVERDIPTLAPQPMKFTSINYHDGKNRSAVRAKTGKQNIMLCQKKDGTTFYRVDIGNYRAGPFETIEDALEARDRRRVVLGLPPALY